jgi:porphobilinogen synthase
MSTLNLRRLRQDPHVRSLTREVYPRLDQLIQPCFVAEGTAEAVPVPGLTGVAQETPDSLLRQVEADLRAGVNKFLLFGVPQGRAARHIDWSFTAGQIRALKRRFGRDLWLATDVCLCSSTPHGHCGVLNPEGDHLDNDATLSELAAAAVAYADAGADCVAPSDMMDGRIGALRTALDGAGHARTVLMSYAVKFHSTLYGPFRVAADSSPKGGGEVQLKDRATYQLDPGRPSDAWLCAERDAAEGADILMVKPGLPYLDLLQQLSAAIRKPWAVYHVSGEYAALEALVGLGLAQRAALHREILTAFKRAGASMIITYGARHAREWLNP